MPFDKNSYRKKDANRDKKSKEDKRGNRRFGIMQTSHNLTYFQYALLALLALSVVSPVVSALPTPPPKQHNPANFPTPSKNAKQLFEESIAPIDNIKESGDQVFANNELPSDMQATEDSTTQNLDTSKETIGQKKEKTNKKGAIIGGGIGSLFGVVIIVVAIYKWIKYTKEK